MTLGAWIELATALAKIAELGLAGESEEHRKVRNEIGVLVLRHILAGLKKVPVPE